MSKNFDETVCLQFEKREEWIRKIRGERPQRIAKETNSAPCLASSSAVSFPRRNECPGIHCSPIEQEEREDSFYQICRRVSSKMKDGEEDRAIVRYEKRSGRLVGAAEISKKHAGWRRLQRKNVSILSLLKRKGWPSATERAVGKYARASFAKRERNRAVCLKHQI